MKIAHCWKILSVLVAIIALCSCSTDEYPLSLAVSGLNGTLNITLNQNGVAADALNFTEDGTKTFTNKLTTSELYSFTINAQPAAQTCTVQNATGFIGQDTTLQAICAATSALSTVTGSVNGLASGETIALALNNGQTQILGSGSFSFNSLPTGYQYLFTVPIGGPGKHCTLTNSSGTVSENVTTMVSCQTVNIVFANGSMYDGNLGGRSGADEKCALIASLMGSHITCDVNKAFLSTSSTDQLLNFPSLYSFRSDLPLYGYDSSSSLGEVLFQNNWAELFTGSFGIFTGIYPFKSAAWSGTDNGGTYSSTSCSGFTTSHYAYSSELMTQSGFKGSLGPCVFPAELGCACLQQDYQVGGTISGLSSASAVIRLTYNTSTTEDVTLTGNGAFYFGNAFSSGASYSASIVSTTANGGCSFTGASSGTVSASSASALNVVCVQGGLIGGTVSGLSGTVVLSLNNSAQTDTISASGAFSFDNAIAFSSAYEVTVGTQPTGQTCTVTNGSGTSPASGDVSDITVSCSANPKKIFVSTSTSTGNLGGISGADATCASQATSLGYSGTYKALLGSATRSTSSNWVLAASTQYVRASDGTTVIGTTNSSATFDFPLTNSIGTAATNSWTGLTSSWGVASDTCSNWSLNDGVFGNIGANNSTSSTAIAGASTQYCGTGNQPLICVEQ